MGNENFSGYSASIRDTRERHDDPQDLVPYEYTLSRQQGQLPSEYADSIVDVKPTLKDRLTQVFDRIPLNGQNLEEGHATPGQNPEDAAVRSARRKKIAGGLVKWGLVASLSVSYINATFSFGHNIVSDPAKLIDWPNPVDMAIDIVKD